MDEEQQRQRADLISRLFALITMKLEDAAGIAADCQGRQPIKALRENAEKLREMLVETVTVADCLTALLS